jgi:LPPG:FO 2-phospho-L-lactate transferase
MAVGAWRAEGGSNDIGWSQQERIRALAITAGTDDDGPARRSRGIDQDFEVARRDQRHVAWQDDGRPSAQLARGVQPGGYRGVHVTWVCVLDRVDAALFGEPARNGLVDDGERAGQRRCRFDARVENVGEHRPRETPAVMCAKNPCEARLGAVADARHDDRPDRVHHVLQCTQQPFGRLNSIVTQRIVALAGGVGGSRFARGLHAAAPDAELTIIVNTGDDVTLHGLHISPDVDTVLYALSGLVDEKRGWGPLGDTFQCMDALERLGGETWFRLGDIDLATHLRRTELLASGWPPSQVTAELASRLGIQGIQILPMTDAAVETWVELRDDRRWVHFQEYFVRRRTDVSISGVEVRGLAEAAPGPGVIEALEAADLIALCPSNPFVSIGPILDVRGVRDAIEAARRRGVQVAAVSPLIGGATIKGPAARMLSELGFAPTAAGVLAVYRGLVDVYLIDPLDQALAPEIERLGAWPVVADALMRGRRGETRLARVLLRAVRRPAPAR